MIAACIVIATVAGTNPGLAPVTSFDFSNSTPVVGETIQLFDTSIHEPTAWAWQVNGAPYSNEQNPSFYCDSSGFVTFMLTASNQFGSNSHSDQIYVDPGTGGILP